MPAPWENCSRPLGLIVLHRPYHPRPSPRVASTLCQQEVSKRGEEIRPIHLKLMMGSAIDPAGPRERSPCDSEW